jgi:ATP-binding cassette, subfamily B, bacterial
MSGQSHPERQGRKPRPRQSARQRAARVLHPLIPYVRQRLGRLSLALSGAIGVTAMRLLEPWPLKIIVDHLFFDLPLPHAVAGWLPEDANLLLLAMVGTIVVVGLCAGGFYYLQRLMVSAVAIEITTSLRSDLYEHLHRLAPGHHDRQRLGETLTRLTADMRVMREGLVTVPIRLVEGLLLMTGMVAIMLVLDWQLALTAVLLLPLWAIVSGRLSRRLGPALARHRMREGAISDRAAESMSAVYVVQGFDGHAREQERFRIAEERSAEAAMRAARLAGVIQIASGALVGLGGAALVGLASWKVIHGQLTPGDLLIFVAYAALFLKPLREFAPLSVRLMRAMVAGERVVGLLETVPSIREAPDARRVSRVRGEISMKDVTVRASDGRPILDRVNLVVHAGEHVVLTGSTGAGKSTLINLVLRFLDPDDGAVCIDGRDISKFTIKSLRSQITTVHQEPLLFSMSIADNIAYAREGATRAEVEAAAEAAGVAGLIRALTEGFDTQVGERGAALSGGERQAVSIARAMIRDTPIVILDEPTTALDPSAAQVMISSLMRLARGRTILTVTHDPRLVRYGDRILSLEGGRIIDNGLESNAPRGSVVTAPD